MQKRLLIGIAVRVYVMRVHLHCLSLTVGAVRILYRDHSIVMLTVHGRLGSGEPDVAIPPTEICRSDLGPRAVYFFTGSGMPFPGGCGTPGGGGCI